VVSEDGKGRDATNLSNQVFRIWDIWVLAKLLDGRYRSLIGAIVSLLRCYLHHKRDGVWVWEPTRGLVLEKYRRRKEV
jgi:hypothetical protein